MSRALQPHPQQLLAYEYTPVAESETGIEPEQRSARLEDNVVRRSRNLRADANEAIVDAIVSEHRNTLVHLCSLQLLCDVRNTHTSTVLVFSLSVQPLAITVAKVYTWHDGSKEWHPFLKTEEAVVLTLVRNTAKRKYILKAFTLATAISPVHLSRSVLIPIRKYLAVCTVHATIRLVSTGATTTINSEVTALDRSHAGPQLVAYE